MGSWRAGVLLLLLAVPAGAQTHDLSWYTVDGGGATFSVAGTFGLGGTIGQPDAGAGMTGGSYALVGGFWGGTLAADGSVDLTLSLGDAPDPVTGNQTLTYTLGVSNLGPDTATNVTLTQDLPAGVAFQSLMGPGWACGEAGGVVTCTRTGLAPGAAPNVTVQVTVPPGGGVLTSDASVASAPEAEANADDNVASAMTTVTGIPYANLAVAKTDHAVTALWGRPLTYTVTASNAGPNAVTGATVTDNFSANLASVTWTCTASVGSSCQPSGSGHISDSTVNLLPSGTATYVATGTVLWGTAGPIPNTATVGSATFDPAAANNTSSINTPVNADLIFRDGFDDP